MINVKIDDLSALLKVYCEFAHIVSVISVLLRAGFRKGSRLLESDKCVRARANNDFSKSRPSKPTIVLHHSQMIIIMLTTELLSYNLKGPKQNDYGIFIHYYLSIASEMIDVQIPNNFRPYVTRIPID